MRINIIRSAARSQTHSKAHIDWILTGCAKWRIWSMVNGTVMVKAKVRDWGLIWDSRYEGGCGYWMWWRRAYLVGCYGLRCHPLLYRCICLCHLERSINANKWELNMNLPAGTKSDTPVVCIDESIRAAVGWLITSWCSRTVDITGEARTVKPRDRSSKTDRIVSMLVFFVNFPCLAMGHLSLWAPTNSCKTFFDCPTLQDQINK